MHDQHTLHDPGARAPGDAERDAVWRPRLRLLHTSDVHLGAHDAGEPSRREDHHAAFSRVIDLARREAVDLLIVAGDLFDHAFVCDETLAFAIDELRRLELPAVLVPGNHDRVGPGSVYDRLPEGTIPDNVRLVRSPGGEVVAVDALGLEIWARAHGPGDFSPLGAPALRGSAPWQVAVGHGHAVRPGQRSSASFQITTQQLAATERDYVALGHWEHLTRIPAGRTVTAAYSGAPTGPNHASGAAGRALIAEFDDASGVRLTAHSLDDERTLSHDEIPLGLYES